MMRSETSDLSRKEPLMSSDEEKRRRKMKGLSSDAGEAEKDSTLTLMCLKRAFLATDNAMRELLAFLPAFTCCRCSFYAVEFHSVSGGTSRNCASPQFQAGLGRD